jgi:hypothetical protein
VRPLESRRGVYELRRERNGPRSGKCLTQPGEHHQVSVERDPLQAADAKRRESEVVLQVSEAPLHRGATPVQILEPLSVASDRVA